jgi:eukaryotic-like serine/threonine-protein kinase
MSSQLKSLAGRYLLESEIARGGMGTIWKARDEVLARPVAVKILRSDLSKDEAFLERFRREALAAARLSHPNIVSIYDTGAETGDDEQAESHYIVMEFCGRGTLEAMISAGPTPAERVIEVGQTICAALGYAHENDVVHRDVKPANVLITDDGSLKVADFGIAKAAFISHDITTTGAILGTVTYLSPEQAQGQEPDHRSDLYSLGVVLYELATGRPPFVDENQLTTAMKHLKDPPPPPRSIRAGIPRSLEAVIMKALEKDPDDRFVSAREMSGALGEGIKAPATQMMPARATRPKPQTGERSARLSRSPLKWIAVVLALAIVAAVLVFVLPNLLESNDDPGTGEGNSPGAAPGLVRLDIVDAQDFDPHGGDGEHPAEVGNAWDSNEKTLWETENYSDALAAQGKPGVGLVFDLGEPRTVEKIRVAGNPGDFEVLYSDEIGADETAFSHAATSSELTIELDEPVEAQYWLVWITRLPNDIGSATIGEVVFFGQ